jgi:hypothetical protein
MQREYGDKSQLESINRMIAEDCLSFSRLRDQFAQTLGSDGLLLIPMV